MSTKINELKQEHGTLTVLKQAENDQYGNAMWVCECVCGNITKVRGSNLRNQTRSCGCIRTKTCKDTT